MKIYNFPQYSLQKRILILSCLIIITGLFSRDIYIPSIPSITDYFHGEKVFIQSSLTACLIGVAISQVFYGPLSDYYGRKNILLVGLVIAFLGNFSSFLTSSAVQFWITRLLTGFGTGVCFVITRAIARDCYEKKSLARAISYLSMTTTISPAAAPLIGGLFQTYFGWRSNFAFLALLSVLSIIFVLLYLPETNICKNFRNVSIKNSLEIYLELLNNKIFIGCIIFISAAFSSGIIYYIITPFIFQKLLGYNIAETGFIYIFSAVGYFLGALFVSRVTDEMHDKKVILLGIIICLSSAVTMAVLYVIFSARSFYILIPATVNAFGCGLIIPCSNKVGLSLFPNYAGTAAALLASIAMLVVFLVSVPISHISTYTPLSLAFFLIGFSFFALVAYFMVNDIGCDLE